MRDIFLWFVAGEESGDARSVEVMQAIKAQHPSVIFGGAGGNAMQKLCEQQFDNWVQHAAVTGLWDVLKNYGYFRQKFRAMLAAIREKKPDAVVLVDYPGFNLRLARRLRDTGYQGKILYYISPQVWAWNRGRIPKMARFLDLMICVFPFEAPMYQASGLHTAFVGHPLLESLAAKRGGIERETNLLSLFPGSREREVKQNFPVMLEAARLVAEKMPGIRFEASAAGCARAENMRKLADGFPVEIREGNAHELMQRATAGIVCSGTATLEAAFFGLPYCLIYKTAWLTFEIGKRLVDVNALGIINILNNYRLNPPPNPALPAKSAPHLVREFIQNEATPEALAKESLRLLQSASTREELRSQLTAITSLLKAEGASERSATTLLRSLHE
jgi:lipid-A-disaccharide synthase